MKTGYKHLTDKERYKIEFFIQEKLLQKEIAERLNKDKSCISRELNRNSVNGVYIAETAIKLTEERYQRETFKKFTEAVKEEILEHLKDHWSPEQISGRMKKDKIASISHEHIYQYIDEGRKSCGNLYLYLPHRGKKYKKRNIKGRKKIWKTAKPRTSISERPSKVSAKKEAFHWEGDTVESKGHSGGIATFVEMKNKYTLLRKVEDKSADTMKNVIINSFTNCVDFIRPLTLDNGTEFALHDVIAERLNTTVYFANPYSPWQRGLNENTNGLLRRFYPKGTDFSNISERKLLKTQDMLNNRPRKCLDYRTPSEAFMKEVLKSQAYTGIAQYTF